MDRYLAIVEETNYGEEPASPAWKYFDISSTDLSGPDDQGNVYETVGALAPRIQAPGKYVLGGSTAIPIDDVNFGLILKGLFGAVTSTQIGTTAFYTHTFTPATDLPSFTFEVGKDNFAHKFYGVMINELSLEYEDGFLVAGLSLLGAKDGKGTLQSITAADFPAFVYTDLLSTVTKGGVDISAKIEGMSLSINRNLNMEDGIPVNSRFPTRKGYPQGLQVTGELTISFEDSTELEYYWGSATGPATSLTEHDFVFDFIHTANERELSFSLPRVLVQSHSAPVEARNRIQQTISIQALTDDVTGNAIEAQLVNDQTSY